ncbi:hypothetical protein [Desulfovibrio sp. ZJ200]|uniref:hypothetical protein n=1 Tax=Desulfovibrio sp. ZJ200 TaxID=2709792 RepID=UPI0013EA6B98|nr:hypothetical protein [Desulfovibrio sp. ZJ200]
MARQNTTPVYDPTTGRLNLHPAANLEELRAQIQQSLDAGFDSIDAKIAYAILQPNQRNEPDSVQIACDNLQNAIVAVQGTLANMKKRTGVSCIYNVLDGRDCHHVKCERIARRLENSKKLSEFIDTTMGQCMTRTGDTGLGIRESRNGKEYTCDRRQYVAVSQT